MEIKEKDGNQSVTLQTPVIDDKGKVVGTEARRFTIIVGGRNLVVHEDCPAPTEQEQKFVAEVQKDISKDPYSVACLLSEKDSKEMARLRRAFRESAKIEFVDFVKSSFKTNLGNFVSSISYPLPEFLADEVHLATMGLSDNFGSIVDVISSVNKDILEDVRLFYGIKFGDGRYEVKSTDGKGDQEKLEKDVTFALKGKKQQLIVSKIRAIGVKHAESDGKEFISGESKDFEKFVNFVVSASQDQLTSFQKQAGDETKLKEIAEVFGGGDKELARAVYGAISPKHHFWIQRLHQALSPKINRKLLLRVISVNDPAERRTLAAMYEEQFESSLDEIFKGEEEEMKFLRVVFGKK